jgi:nicotinate-nucleotide adenylyltransferase
MAAAAVSACGLDRVVFVPCRISPLKGWSPGAGGDERMEMLRLATEGRPWAEVSGWELGRPGPSYSWETVEHFRSLWPSAELHWIMGEDQWADLERWARPELLRERLHFIVFARNGSAPQRRPGWRLTVVAGEWSVSSTRVREALAAGVETAELLPAAVAGYIARQGLYRSPR